MTVIRDLPPGSGKTPPRHRRKRNYNWGSIFDTHRDALSRALVARGVDPDVSERMAGLILRQPGIRLGPDRIRFGGQRYGAEAFAKTKLVDRLSGLLAERQNRSLIEGEPGYQSALAELGYERDTGLSALDAQRRQAVLDFGDPAMTNDPLLAAEAGANPYSVQQLLAQAVTRQRAEAAQQANRYGTFYGGGLQSGYGEVARQAASQRTEGYRTLSDLLSGLEGQRADIRNRYGLGQARGLQDATQRLLESGQYHAVTAPRLRRRRATFYDPRRKLGHRSVYY